MDLMSFPNQISTQMRNTGLCRVNNPLYNGICTYLLQQVVLHNAFWYLCIRWSIFILRRINDKVLNIQFTIADTSVNQIIIVKLFAEEI